MRRRTNIDFSKWAIVSYKDDTGLGRMAEDARRVLGLGCQIVIPSRRLTTKPLAAGDFLLSSESTDAELEAFLAELDGLILLEKADWTPTLVPLARKLGLAMVAVPMWEWFRREDPLWKLCDLFVCPNQKCHQVLRSAGFTNCAVLPWLLDLSRFPDRKVKGSARLFVHNAGLVDADDRKGTSATIESFKHVSDPELRLLVRLQKSAARPEGDSRIELRIGNMPDPASLWQEGEVAIQPSKMEGIGFMILEPICSGMPVITLNAAPMNEYAAELLVTPKWFSRKAWAAQWVSHASLRIPRVFQIAEKIRFCAETDLEPISRRQRSWAEETFSPETLRAKWVQALQPLVSNPVVVRPVFA
jgi:glycosyltransferase involved in cell wall biosynthesis